MLTSPISEPKTSKAPTVASHSATSSQPTVVASPKTTLVNDDDEDYGGSTEVDEVDTEDEIDM